jgi:hypothetical protein
VKIGIAILVFGCIVAMAQDSLTSGGNFLGANVGNPAQEKAAQEAAQERQKQLFDSEYRNFIPKDPWRAIDGKTNYAKGDGWDGFFGKVLEVQSNGIRIEGDCVRPGANTIIHPEQGEMIPEGYYATHQEEFFVENYPYQCTESESLSLSENLTAKEVGVYTYQTVMGGTRTIPKLVYGVPCAVPAELVEKAIQTAKAQADAKAAAIKRQKEESDKNAVKWLLTQVTNGDASAQCDLGERYLNGQGVETNRETAIYWLTQAANQGDIEASNMLTKLK